MAEHNRNRSNQFNEDWDQNHHRSNREDEDRNRQSYGNFGNSSYEKDYQNRRMKGYGNASYGSDKENQEGYGGSYNSNYGSGYGGSYGSQFENRNEQRSQGNWQNTGSYGSQNRNENDWNRSGNQHNQGWEQRRNTGSYGGREYNSAGNYGGASGYGNSGGYGNQQYGNDRDRGWWDRTRDEVSSWFGDDDAERRRRMDESRRGEHKGKGPKDYRRSEERIREDVCDRLSDDDRLDATHIQVQIQGDEVILTGTVNERDQKRRAEDLVEHVSGVRNVENRIRVERGDTSGSREYTGNTTQFGGIGNESGTTNEIIRNAGK